MIRALLTDLDGVIRSWEGVNPPEILGVPLKTIRQIAFERDLLLQAVTGQIRDEAWRRETARRLQIIQPEVDARAVVERWSTPAGKVNTPVLNLIQTCRKNIPVILVTNATTRLPSDLAQLGLSNEFDAIINSSAIGYAKPHPAFYSAALSAANVSAHEALFVDDSFKNVKGAKGQGLYGHHFEGIEGFKNKLVHLGILSLNS